jgi:glycosyltransferase involved in cell wall biosynthesis
MSLKRAFAGLDMHRLSCKSPEVALKPSTILPCICIVTPGQIGSNPRVVKEAQALHECGFDVTVIATRTLDVVEPRDQSLLRRVPWRVVRLDLRDRRRWRLRRAAQVAFRRAHAMTGLAGFADRGFSAFTRPLLEATLCTPADLYIAHYPAALPAVAAAARRYGARYAYDAEDFHLGDWPDVVKYEPERRVLRAIESRRLLQCAYITAASPGIADAYAAAYAIAQPEVLLNVFPLNQAPPGPTERGTAAPRPSVYWFSQTIGADRGLECAVRAIARTTTRAHLFLRGSPAAGYLNHLNAMAAELDLTDRLHILPPDEPDRMEALAAEHDVGLGSEPAHTINNSLALSNKLFTYLLAGIPAAMSDTPAQRAFAVATGTMSQVYPINDHEALATILDSLLGDPARLAAARAKAYRLGQERYNWEREGSKFIEMATASIDSKEDRKLTSAHGA